MKDYMKKTMEEMLFGYGKREVDCVAGSTKAYVGMSNEPWMSKARPNKPAIISGLMVVLDNLFKKKIASIVGDEYSFTEYKWKDKEFFSTFNGCEISFDKGEVVEDYEILTPIVMWSFTEECNATEFKERMAEAIQSYLSNGSISVEQAYGLCDSFYYEVCSKCKDQIPIYTDDVMPETFKQGYVSGQFDYVDEFNGLSCPGLSFLKGVEVNKEAKAKWEMFKKREMLKMRERESNL